MKSQQKNETTDLTQEIVKLVQENPNNYDLGEKVRILVNSLSK
jgi:uncharacterized protein YaaW (UPF0174 family)